MLRRSGRLASRRSGDAIDMPVSLSKTPKERDEKRSEEEKGESSSTHAKDPQERDDDDTKSSCDHDAVTHDDSGIHIGCDHHHSHEDDKDEDFVVDGEEDIAPSEPSLDNGEAPSEEEEEESELDGSSRPNKKARITIESAEDWIRNYNQMNPIDKNDPDLQRFQAAIKDIITRLCLWARADDNGSNNAWYRLTAAERSITRPLRAYLAVVNIQELIDNILEHIPHKAQKILGKRDLKPIDLIDLPEIPQHFKHRLVYADIPVRAGVNNITRQAGVIGTLIKSAASLDSSMNTKVYLGSSINMRGGYVRIHTHEEGSEGRGQKCSHYDYTKQSDVVPNLRAIGIYSNPHMVESLNPDNDTHRWLPVFLEGILMVYLGLIHRQYRGSHDSTALAVFAEPKYAMVDYLRDNLELPDFHNESLNVVWCLAQGVNGGMTVVNECGNPACKRPRMFHGKEQTFFTSGGQFSARVCEPCYRGLKKNGKLRTENKSNHVRRMAPRVCDNPNCGKVDDGKGPGNFSRSQTDKTKWKCSPCWHYYHDNQRDRPAGPIRGGRIPAGRTCANPNCGYVHDPSKKMKWRQDPSDDTKWRCLRCHSYFAWNGDERPCQDDN
ncbi:hypothetical protein FNAPI_11802 [Fusarium napiforme]|uniref:Uncharacterized protein n=1 Tax=Fusarium napiforme TaxID=42672 RepID=A0A8H5MPR5_9HYPO|nr:hypothetical protein FNAPI_11802 [Fusarium napiforme]